MSSDLRAMQRHFGGQLDADVLSSILAMFDGNRGEAIKFLEGGQGEPMSFQELQVQSESGLPKNYPAQGPKYMHQVQVAHQQSGSSASSDVLLEIAACLADERFDVCIEQLVRLMAAHRIQFTVSVVMQIKSGVEFGANLKTRLLAAALIGDKLLAKFLLKKTQFGLAEVLGAAKLLDGQRRLRSMRAKLARWTAAGAKATKLSALRGDINNLATQKPFGALTSSIKKKILLPWVRAIPAAKLREVCAGLSTSVWRELIDMLHIAPSTFQLEYFSAFVFSGKLPSDCDTFKFRELMAKVARGELERGSSALVEELCKHQVPYSALRSADCGFEQRHLPARLRAHVASYESVHTLIWHYEELSCREANEAIVKQLESDEQLDDFGYGKLLERSMVLPTAVRAAVLAVAQKRLSEIRLPLESPVLVLGDASDSMSVAIRLSTILSSLLATLADAQLRFFNDKSIQVDSIPQTAQEVVERALRTKPSGLTAPAAGLYEFYERKEFLNTIILVSDEIENEPFHKMFFPTLLKKYRDEVNPNVRIALVSFRDEPQRLGRIHSALLKMKIEPLCALALNANRPDASKIDSLLSSLALTSDDWLRSLRHECREKDLQLRREQETEENNLIDWI